MRKHHINYNLFLVVLLTLPSLFGCAHLTLTDVSVPIKSASVNTLRNRLTNYDGDVMVIAHRACWRLAPENSIKSIKECIRLGVDMVEIDIQRTRDGHLILMHDRAVDRTTNGSGLVAEMTLIEIMALYLKEGEGGENAEVTKHKVPTLRQALGTINNSILVNLDAKGNVREQAYFQAKELGVTDQVLIKKAMSAPEDFDLNKAAFFGNTFFMPIIFEKNDVLATQIISLKVIAPIAYEIIYQTEKQLIDACQVATTQKSRCWVNTLWEELAPGHSDEVSVLDPDKHWGHLVKLGVNMFQTDRPEELINYLESKKLRSL